MDILGIGPMEFLFILIIALIVLGPKDMVKAGKTIGRVLRTVVSSETWRVVQNASQEMRNLPNRLMREAGVDDLTKQLPDQQSISKELGLDDLNNSIGQDVETEMSAWTTPPPTTGTELEGSPEGADEEAQSGSASDSAGESIITEHKGSLSDPHADTPEVEGTTAQEAAHGEAKPTESGDAPSAAPSTESRAKSGDTSDATGDEPQPENT